MDALEECATIGLPSAQLRCGKQTGAEAFHRPDGHPARFDRAEHLCLGGPVQFVRAPFEILDGAAGYLRLRGEIGLRPVEQTARAAAERWRENPPLTVLNPHHSHPYWLVST